MNLLTMLIPNLRASEKTPNPGLSRGVKILSGGLNVEGSSGAGWSVCPNPSTSFRPTALEGHIVGLESYAGRLRAVWLEHHIIAVDEASQGVSSLRLNRPVRLMVVKKGSSWVLREVILLPEHPTLVELEPLETPPLIGFAEEPHRGEPNFSMVEPRYI